MSTFELGPAVVARVACFPLAALGDMASTGLAEQAAAAHDGRGSLAAYQAAYEAELEAERATLWRHTAGDPNFMLALAFANPRLAGIVAAEPAGAPDRKDRRHIESRLYRYLARASSRSEPFGMWAGVTLARFSQHTRVTRTSSRVRVTPDLAPWYEIVRALGRRLEYRRRSQWQLNPSLDQLAEREWRVWAREEDGFVGRTVQGWNTEPFRLMAECSPASLDRFAEALVPCCGSRLNAEEAVEVCVAAGILVGGLEPEWRFETVWQALEAVEARLLTAHVGAWRSARVEMRSRCEQLEERGESLASTDVLTAMRDARSTLQSLAARLELPAPAFPEALLRCDLNAGFEIELGEDIRSRIVATLSDYLRFQARWGFGPGMRRAVLAHYMPPGTAVRPLGALPPPLSGAGQPTWQALAALLALDDDVADRIERWEHLLRGGPGAEVADGGHDRIAAPPFGWLQLGLRPCADGPRPVVHGVHDDLWGAYARHAQNWSRAEGKDALQAWLLDRLARVEGEAGLEFVELVAPCHSAPNTLARPSLGRPLVSPWSCAPGAIDLYGACMVLAPGAAAPHLECRSLPSRLAVLNASAANVQSGDAVVQLLLSSSLAATPAAVLKWSSMLFASELGGRRSPGVVLAGGAQVRPARTVLVGDDRDALRGGGAARRFAAWAALARREGWPPLLRLRRQDGLTVALHRDSPLALRALLAGSGEQRLVVEELPGEDWLADDMGRRVVVELSIPFLRQHHVWSRDADRSGASAR